MLLMLGGCHTIADYDPGEEETLAPPIPRLPPGPLPPLSADPGGALGSTRLALRSYWGSDCSIGFQQTGLSPISGALSARSVGLATSRSVSQPSHCMQARVASTLPGTQLRVGLASNPGTCSMWLEETGWTSNAAGWSSWSAPVATSDETAGSQTCLQLRLYSTGGAERCRLLVESARRTECSAEPLVAIADGWTGWLLTGKWDGTTWAACIRLRVECEPH